MIYVEIALTLKLCERCGGIFMGTAEQERCVECRNKGLPIKPEGKVLEWRDK